jgi:hypothetical protein
VIAYKVNYGVMLAIKTAIYEKETVFVRQALNFHDCASLVFDLYISIT